MRNGQSKPDVPRPAPRGYKLRDAFAILGISEGTGHALIKAGKIRTVRLGPRLPIITDKEISRLLEEGA
jgi:predicted site-specific integrase-resolvase